MLRERREPERYGEAVMVARGMLTYVLVMFDTERQSGTGKKWFGGVRSGSQGME